MNKLLQILIGLIIFIIPIYAWVINYGGFGVSAIEFLKGAIIWVILLIGAVTLLTGILGLKE